MKRFPRTSSPSSLRVFTSCLLSFLMLLLPVATLAGSVKMAEAAEGQRKLTADQKTEAFLFNAPLPAATPDISATLTDSFADGDGDTKAEFGETITYTSDITNAGPVDATGVKFDATLDPNTDIVPGSVKVSPLAFADSYVATKNTVLNTGAPGLLANDSGQPAPTVSAIVGCADVTAPFTNCDTTQAGGKVTVNADGSFDYTPPSGFEGSDTFQYTISNGQTPDSTATVTINVDAAPTVTATTPVDNAVGVDPTSNITVTFSEPVNVTGAWFTISCTTSGTHTATVTGGPTTFTLNPDTNLVGDETCTVTIVAAQVTDQDSNDPPDQMAADYVFDFTTDAAPAVTTTSPTNGATGVTTDANIIVNFTENINANASSFKIECPAPGNLQAFTYTGASTNTSVITLNPTADLPAGTTCTVTVVALQISDSDAFDPPNNMAADYVFSFTTDAAPAVLSTTPANGATNLATNTTIQVNFSENVNATTNSFKIECPAPGNLQTFTLSASPSNTFTLTPTANLPGGVTCTVTVIALQISDQDGNDPPDKMVADYVFSFSTDAAPQVTSTVPTNTATNVASNANITVNFSESVAVTATAFNITCATSGAHTTVVSSSPATSFTINPDTDFTFGEVCTVTVDKDEVSDTDTNDPPNNMVADYVFTFTVDLPPSVTTTTPTNNQNNVSPNTTVVINFSESVNATSNAFKIECPVGTNKTFTQTASPATSFTLTPSAALPQGVVCTVTVDKDEITDVDAGDPPDNMTADYVFTFNIPPDAQNDSHPANVVGNVIVDSANISFSVTSNDVFASPVTIDKVQAETNVVSNTITTSTAAGGTVVMTVSGANIGKYTYNPPAGYEGGDSFTYQITNGGGSDTATVSLNVSGMVWFINNTAGAGNGRQTSPFNSLAAFQLVNNGTGNNPAAGDNIFIYESGTAYVGPVTLLGNQKLIGQDSTVALTTRTGLDPAPSGGAFPVMNSGNGTITKITSGANAVELPATFAGNHSQIYGLTIGNTTGAGIFAVPGGGQAGFGALTVADVSIDDTSTRTGQALNLQKGTGTANVTATFNVLESSSAVNGIALTNVDGSITINAGSLSALTGADVLVTGGAASLTFSNTFTITNASGEARSIDIQNKTGGTVDFNGLITDNGTGINLLNNASTTLRFDGGLVLATTTSNAFVSTSNGSLAITDPNANGTAPDNTITTTSGTPLNVAFTNILADGLTFKSITANGAVNGISLNTTGSAGGLTITGDTGSTVNASGGTIQSTTSAGISLTSVTGVSLDQMSITNTLGNGITGATSVTNFSITNSTIAGAGDGANEFGIFITNLLGTGTINNTSVTNSQTNNLKISNNNNTAGTVTISNSTFTTTDAVNGGDCVNVETGVASPNQGNLTVNLTDNNDLNTCQGDGIQASANDNSTLRVTVDGSNSNYNGNLGSAVNIASEGNSQTFALVQDFTNVSTGTTGSNGLNVINVQTIESVDTPTLNVTIQNNSVISQSPTITQNVVGIRVIQEGKGTFNANIKDNSVNGRFGTNAVFAQSRAGNGTMNLVFGDSSGSPSNTVTATDPNTLDAVSIEAGSSAGGDANTICLNMLNNVATSAGVGPQQGYRLRKRATPTFRLQDFPSGTVDNWVNVTKNNTGTTDIVVDAGAFTNAPAPCTVAATPLLASPDDVKPAAVAAESLPTETALGALSDAAIKRWAAAGLSAEQVAAIRGLKFELADLPAGYVAEVSGDRIRIDRDADGRGWFVDSTPMDDVEFGATNGARRYTAPAGAPAGSLDLLTALMHEIGHFLNLNDSYAAQSRDDLMYGYLSTGERRLPVAAQAALAQPGANGGTHYLSVEPKAEARQAAHETTGVVKSAKAKAQPAAKPLAPAAPVADLPVTIGTLPAGKTVRVTFQVTVKSAASYTGTNAFVSAQGTVTFDDPNNPPTGTLSVLTDDTAVGPNTGETDPTQTPVDSQPDLVLTKSDGGATAVPGGTISYTLTYNNTNGKREASGVVITETVPANTTFNAGASSAGWSCTPNNNAGSTCTITIGALPAGDAGSSKTFAVTVTPALPAGVTDISNSAAIADDGSKGVDGNPTDNVANDTTPVTAFSDLKITKSDGGVGVQAGNTVTYTLSYENIGNQGATGVVITETVPADSTFNAGASTAGWVCAPNNNPGSTCTITIGAVAAGGSGSVTFAVTTSASPVGAEVSNTASIDDDNNNGPDPSGNDSSSDTTPFDDVPTLGTYSDQTIFVTQGVTVSPTAPPADDNPGFDTDVTVSGAFTGGATVDDDDGDVHITNAAPAGVYTVTVTVTDSTSQTVTRQFQLTVNKSGTTTVVTSDNNPSFNNQNVTFTATVTSNTAVTGPPTGTVDFFDGATLICNDAPLNGSGEATCSTSTLAVSPPDHSITATYNGDATFDTSTSAAFMQTVDPSLNIVVNTLGDAADTNVADEICDSSAAAGEQCTLRAAIETANFVPSDDIITFDPSLNNQTITLAAALDAINGNLTMTGPGAALLKVERNSGAAQFRIFRVNSGKTVTISGLTISGGDSDQDGGGIFNAGTLTLDEVVVSGNSTDNDGGGIRNDSGGTLTITGSTISGNTAANLGGGVSNAGTLLTITESTLSDNEAINGGGISNTGGTLTVTNSTISGNRARNDGGGLRNVAPGSATLTNVTVTDNRADSDSSVNGVGGGVGGGIRRISGAVTLRNTIVADNFNDANPANTPDDISGTVTGSFNLIGAGGAGTLVHGVSGNQVGVDPKLRKLEDNGGPTETHALKPNSPALDAGSNALAVDPSSNPLTDDQRGPGFNRIADSTDAGTVATVDVGAFEAQVDVEDIADKGTAEDNSLPAFNFEVAQDIGIVNFDVTVTSSNTTLVPNNPANLVLGGAGNTRSLAINPVADQHGQTTITVTVSGLVSGVTPVSLSDTFVYTVTPVADTPDAADAATTEDTQSGPIAITRNPVDGSEVSHFRVTGITGGKLFMPDGVTQITNGTFVSFTDATGGLRFTPTANSTLDGHFTIQAATGNILAALGGGTDTSTITVAAGNDPPTLASITNRTINEDAGLQTVNLAGITAGGGESQTLQVTATSSDTAIIPNPTVTYTSPDSTGSLTFTPVANAFGVVEITVTVNDGGGGTESFQRKFMVTVNSVNDAPSFTKGPDQTVAEDSGAHTVNSWATGFSTGPANESTQTLSISTTNDNNALFSSQPSVSLAGVLTYTSAADASGTATVTVTVTDNGGTANGGVNTSGPQTFTITVTPANDAPTLDAIGDRTVAEDAAAQTVNFAGITQGTGDSGQTLTVTATSSNTAVVPDPTVTYTSPNATGSLSFTPVADANGSAIITVTVKDNGGGSDTFTRTFTVTVTEVNDSPTGTNDTISNVAEDSGQRTISFASLTGNDSKGPANENGQALTITGVSAPTGGTVSISGTNVLFTPTADYSGPAGFTYTLQDNGKTNGVDDFKTSTAVVSFNITAANDAPVNTVPGAQGVNKNGTLTFSVANSNLISVADADAGGNNIRVTLLGTKGTITLSTTAGLAFTVGDGTADASMTFTGTIASINAALAGMTFTPTANYTGAASLKINTNDLGNTGGAALSDIDTVSISVTSGGSIAFSATTYSVNESGTSVNVTVKRIGGSNGTVHVTYATSDGTATAGQDYAATSGQLTFNNGEVTKTFNIAITEDTLDEANETVNLTLSNVNGNGDLGSPATAVLTIADNDAAPKLAIDDVTVTEGNAGTTPATFNVTLSTASGQAVTVNYATADQTATAPADYAVKTGTLTFAPGEISKPVAVLVKGETAFEANETFLVNLSVATNATINDAQGVGTINNDDTSTFNLSAATYSVSEGALKATITVNRTGDRSHSASVNYATSDSAGALTACSVINGNASDRCDYETGVGTLRFAAGQASRQIVIPIINDVYKEGPENFIITFDRPVDAELGPTSSATITITDNDAGGAPNPIIASDEFFVRMLYIDILGRLADAPGLAGWLDTLQNCNNPVNCDRAAVAAAFFNAAEFHDRGLFVFLVYRAALGRPPRYDEFISDMARVSGFLTDAELADNKDDFIDQFMTRTEFKTRYNSKVTPTAFVDALLQTAGLPNHPQRAAWISGLTGPTPTLTRADVVRQFVDSTEVSAKFIDEGQVIMLYLVLLRRQPDSAFNDWISFLKTHDLRQTVGGFINSDEYRKRVGP